jgi:hypothetical protein
MRRITCEQLKSNDINVIRAGGPVCISFNGNKALECKAAYFKTFEEAIDFLKRLQDDGNIIYIYDTWVLDNDNDNDFVIRYAAEQKEQKNVIVKDVEVVIEKMIDFTNFYGEEIVKERIIEDIRYLLSKYTVDLNKFMPLVKSKS